MYCSKCGAQVEENANYCRKCGAEVKREGGSGEKHEVVIEKNKPVNKGAGKSGGDNEGLAILLWLIIVCAFLVVVGDLSIFNIVLILLVKNSIFPIISPGSDAVTQLEEGGKVTKVLRSTWYDFSKRPLNGWFFAGGLVSSFGNAVAEQASDTTTVILIAISFTFLGFYFTYKWLVKTSVNL